MFQSNSAFATTMGSAFVGFHGLYPELGVFRDHHCDIVRGISRESVRVR